MWKIQALHVFANNNLWQYQLINNGCNVVSLLYRSYDKFILCLEERNRKRTCNVCINWYPCKKYHYHPLIDWIEWTEVLHDKCVADVVYTGLYPGSAYLLSVYSSQRSAIIQTPLAFIPLIVYKFLQLYGGTTVYRSAHWGVHRCWALSGVAHQCPYFSWPQCEIRTRAAVDKHSRATRRFVIECVSAHCCRQLYIYWPAFNSGAKDCSIRRCATPDNRVHRCATAVATIRQLSCRAIAVWRLIRALRMCVCGKVDKSESRSGLHNIQCQANPPTRIWAADRKLAPETHCYTIGSSRRSVRRAPPLGSFECWLHWSLVLHYQN